jgi:membrane associated rhomboid family serine protease
MRTVLDQRPPVHVATWMRRHPRQAHVGVGFAALGVVVAALVPADGSATRDLRTLVGDRGERELWRLLAAGFLAGGWAQWAWTALVGLGVFALLRATVGRASVLGCLLATHLMPTVAVAVATPLVGGSHVRATVDAVAAGLVAAALVAVIGSRRSSASAG